MGVSAYLVESLDDVCQYSRCLWRDAALTRGELGKGHAGDHIDAAKVFGGAGDSVIGDAESQRLDLRSVA